MHLRHTEVRRVKILKHFVQPGMRSALHLLHQTTTDQSVTTINKITQLINIILTGPDYSMPNEDTTQKVQNHASHFRSTDQR